MIKAELAFLIKNMMEMEIELRAHSILLDALVAKVITLEEIPENLQLARQAPAMLTYVTEKYRLLGELGSNGAEKGECAVSTWVSPIASRGYTH